MRATPLLLVALCVGAAVACAPGDACGHGACVPADAAAPPSVGTCVCEAGWGGAACDEPRCGPGAFSEKHGKCACPAPYVGAGCERCRAPADPDKGAVCHMAHEGAPAVYLELPRAKRILMGKDPDVILFKPGTERAGVHYDCACQPPDAPRGVRSEDVYLLSARASDYIHTDAGAYHAVVLGGIMGMFFLVVTIFMCVLGLVIFFISRIPGL